MMKIALKNRKNEIAKWIEMWSLICDRDPITILSFDEGFNFLFICSEKKSKLDPFDHLYTQPPIAKYKINKNDEEIKGFSYFYFLV